MKKLTTENFIERSIEKHGNIFDYSLCEYLDSHSKVKIICPNGHIFEQKANDHLNGNGCKFCHYEMFSKSKSYDINIIKEKLLKKYNDKFSYDFANYETLESKIKCICPEHGSFEIRVSSLLKGKNCWKCKGTQPFKLNFDLFIERTNIIHGKYYDYSKVNYIDRKTKIKIGCPIHGFFEQTAGAHLNGQGCPTCKMSKGEKNVRLFLLNNGIDFIPQYTFDDLKSFSFDFYLPKFNTCIEYDGEYHYNEYIRVGGKTYLEKIQKRDYIKNEYCKTNGITMLRIPYWDFKLINNILSEYFFK